MYLISAPILSAGKWEHVYCPMEESNPSRAAGLGCGHLFSGTVSGRQALLPSPPSCSWDLSLLQPPDSRRITAPSLCFQTPLHTPQMSRSVGLKMTVCFKTLQKVKENRTEMHADEKQERKKGTSRALLPPFQDGKVQMGGAEGTDEQDGGGVCISGGAAMDPAHRWPGTVLAPPLVTCSKLQPHPIRSVLLHRSFRSRDNLPRPLLQSVENQD